MGWFMSAEIHGTKFLQASVSVLMNHSLSVSPSRIAEAVKVPLNKKVTQTGRLFFFRHSD